MPASPISTTSRSAASPPCRSISERYRLLTAADAPLGDRDTVTWAEVAQGAALPADARHAEPPHHRPAAARRRRRVRASTLESNSMILLFSHVRTGRWASVMPAQARRDARPHRHAARHPDRRAGSGPHHRPRGAGARADDAARRGAGRGSAPRRRSLATEWQALTAHYCTSAAASAALRSTRRLSRRAIIILNPRAIFCNSTHSPSLLRHVNFLSAHRNSFIDSTNAHPHSAIDRRTGATHRPRSVKQETRRRTRGGPRDELAFIPRPQSHDRQTGLQPLDGAAGRAVRASVHRPGLRVQRVQSADDQAASASRNRRRTTGSSPSSAGSSRSPSSSSASRRPCSAAGSRKAARAARCSPPRCAGPAASSSPRSASTSHNLWLIYLGYGVLGGIALGIGYISPVSTLIKWFPDRPAWRPAWPSWASAAAPSSPRRCRCG